MIVARRDGHAIPETVRFLKKKFLKICWMIVIQIMNNKKLK